MIYKLENDGDPLEQKSWYLFIKDKFPNYEKFWQRYVVPKTNRPEDIFLKAEYSNNENVVFITQIHYSIIQHFFSIYKTCDEKILDFLTFEYLYPKLTTIFDLTEDLLFRFIIELNIINIHSFVDNNGNLISRKEEILKSNIDSENIKEIYTLIKSIKKYRNIIIHSWNVFYLFDATYKLLYVPKKEKLNNLRNWTEISNKLRNNDEEFKNSFFINARQLLLKDTDDLIRLLNLIWGDLLELKE